MALGEGYRRLLLLLILGKKLSPLRTPPPQPQELRTSSLPGLRSLSTSLSSTSSDPCQSPCFRGVAVEKGTIPFKLLFCFCFCDNLPQPVSSPLKLDPLNL